jgi:hypothetical protein
MLSQQRLFRRIPMKKYIAVGVLALLLGACNNARDDRMAGGALIGGGAGAVRAVRLLAAWPVQLSVPLSPMQRRPIRVAARIVATMIWETCIAAAKAFSLASRTI